MISTVAMIRLGYVSGNHMTNMKTSNEKLQYRAVRILMDEAKIDEVTATKLMENAGGDLRVALVMHRANADLRSAQTALERSSYVVDAAVSALEK